MILYEGPSMIDGNPIVMIATGTKNRSNNRKTGDMIQTWILRQDVSPVEAMKDGRDKSICGTCPHGPGAGDGGRSCYVNVGQAPLSVWRAYRRGAYPVTDGLLGWADGRAVRLGAYGDPGAVPFERCDQLVRRSAAHTGYTHQWRSCDERYREICMASVDTVEEARVARSRGWRTFRTRLQGSESRLGGESVCPASGEAGHLLTCESCLACSGSRQQRRGSIVLDAHGSAPVTRAYERRFRGIAVVTEAA